MDTHFYPLHDAARTNNVVELTRLIKTEGYSANYAQKESGCHPLHIAASVEGNAAAVKALLELGADVDVVAKEDVGTPLHAAAKSGDIEMVKLLVEVGKADVLKTATDAAISPLFFAAQSGSLECFLFLLNAILDVKGDSNLQTADRFGATWMHYAALSGNVELLDYLFDVLEVKKDSKTKRRERPILNAAKSGSLTAVRFFSSVSAFCEDSHDTTPLMFAAKSGNFELFDFILNSMPDGKQGLHNTDDYVLSALHYAVIGGNLRIVKSLVENGVNPSTTRQLGVYIAAHGTPDMLQYLAVEKGCDIRKSNFQVPATMFPTFPICATAFIREQESDDDVRTIAMLKAFIELGGINPNSDSDDFTFDADNDYERLHLLHVMAMCGKAAAIEYLVTSYGLDVDIRDGGNRTPLMVAAKFGKMNAVRMLKRLGADVRAVAVCADDPSQQLTAIQCAIQGNPPSFVTADLIDEIYSSDAASNNNEFVAHLSIIGSALRNITVMTPPSSTTSLSAEHPPTVTFLTREAKEAVILHLLKKMYADPNISDEFKSKMDAVDMDAYPPSFAQDAAEMGFVNIFKYFAEERKVDVKRLPQLLAVAAESGRHDLIQYIVETVGVDPKTYVLDNGMTVLFPSVSYDDVSVVKYFVSRGADPHACLNAETSAISNCLDYAVFCGSNTIAKYLIAGPDEGGLGVDVNAPSAEGSPFITAVAQGNLEIVRLMLATNKVDVGFKCQQDGENALHAAARCHHATPDAVHIVKLLLASGFDVNAKTNTDSLTPLQMACRNYAVHMVYTLAFGSGASNTFDFSHINDDHRTNEDAIGSMPVLPEYAVRQLVDKERITKIEAMRRLMEDYLQEQGLLSVVKTAA